MFTLSRYDPEALRQVFWPVLTFGLVSLVLEQGHIDLRVADWLYQYGGNAWSWRDAWLTHDVIHAGGRTLVAAMAIALLVAFAGAWLTTAGRKYRKGLSYLVLSTFCAALLINILKELTRLDCPWDLTRYGGQHPYTGLFEFASWSTRNGACFPAGHASAGYAWFGAYYLAMEYRPRWQRMVFAAVLSLGLIFGIGQIIRGAHFVSHDWWTAYLCWFVATAFHRVFYRRQNLPVAARPHLISSVEEYEST